MDLGKQRMKDLNQLESGNNIFKPAENSQENEGKGRLDLVSISQAGEQPKKKGDNGATVSHFDHPPANRSPASTDLDFSPFIFKNEVSGGVVKPVDERLDKGRKHMTEIAEKYMTKFYPSVLNGKMYQYAPTFEQDRQHLEDRLNAGKVSKEEVARTYESIGKLVDTDNGAVSRNRRVQLAKNIMFHAGSPTKTDQGPYNTCALTAEEERLFTRTPGMATEILTEAATTGQWVAPDGKVIKLDKLSLIPKPESGIGQPIDTERSYATQIMNNILANDIHQRKENPETYVQLQDRDKAGHRLRFDDDGERVFSKSGKEVKFPDGTNERSPMVDDLEIGAQIKRLTGETGVVITNKHMIEGMQEVPIKHSKMELKDVVRVSTQKEFIESLKKMKEENQFPVILGLDGSDKSLSRGLPPHKKEKGEEGPMGHMLSVTDYDAARARVRISNQWGEASDRWLSVGEIYSATDPKIPPLPKSFKPHH